MDYREKTLDRLILGILKEDPTCNLVSISEELKLPKTEIMKRIRYLCQNDYLTFSDKGFFTTTQGDSVAVSLDSILQSRCLYSDANTDPEFNWQNCAYIPTPRSFSFKKK